MSSECSREAGGSGEHLHNFVSNPIAMGITGLALGFVFAWFSMVWPLTEQLKAREKSLEEWSRINREERQAISDIKGMSTEELRKWVATLDEQNVRYAQLQRAVHRQELALSGPAYGYVLIALVAVLGTAAVFVWITRDSNADAARTLENAASVLPSMRKALEAGRGEQLLESEELSTPMSPQGPPLAEPGPVYGVVTEYAQQRGFGWVSPGEGEESVFFHKNEVRFDCESGIPAGLRVTFRYGTDRKGRKCAQDVQRAE